MSANHHIPTKNNSASGLFSWLRSQTVESQSHSLTSPQWKATPLPADFLHAPHTKGAAKKLTDDAIIKAVTLEGKTELYGLLYDRYSDKVYRKCISFAKDPNIAQDMVQDIFMKVFFQLPKFKGNSRFSTWLYTITYNFCVEYYRKNKKHTFVDIQNQPDAVDDSQQELELLQTRSDKLKRALEELNPEDRAILLMKYQDNISIKELMNSLEVSESAVKMRLARARQRAKEIIDEMPD
jgi:RNA polymerase sigma factor (sigma-70 family)